MITAKGISKYFRKPDGGLFTALDNVDMTVHSGQLAVIAGENGSGKSLLMRILASLERPSEGTVQTEGDIGLVFQDADSQILADTPLEDVMFGLRSRKDLRKTEMRDAAMKALDKVGLSDCADNPSHLLSGGQKRRLAVASILALGRKIMIFDEPYSNLDFPGVKSVNAIIKDLKDNGYTIIILTHELEKCLALADRFMVLNRGKMVFDGEPSEALSLDLEKWGIRNPGKEISDLVWI